MRLIGNLAVDLPDFAILDHWRAPPAAGMFPARTTESGKGVAGPLRLLMFAPNLNREGAPISQFELTRALRRRGGIDAEVVSFADGPLRAAYEAEGIPVAVVPSCLDRIPTVKRLRDVVAELSDLISRRQPDVVYANTLLTFVAVLAAFRAGVPSVLNPRESEAWRTYFGFLNREVAREALASLALPHRVVFVSEASRRVWASLDVKRNFTVICNGLDPRNLRTDPGSPAKEALRRELGYDSDEVVFLCVGTLCERKGQADVLGAMARLAGTTAGRVRVALVGEGQSSYGRRLRAGIGRLRRHLRDRVRIHGPAADLGRHYAAADVLVHCARTESYPRVILEAMAFGLPIITTPVFGILEQVAENENALLFSPGDCVQLAGHMEKLAGDRELRARLGRGSRSRLERLTTFDQMVDAYRAVFQGAAGSPA
ncbi:MAG TPA: glycosyltransferase family 4 protein [Rhodocyclaceae bacterium]|nr:glycosyltransferase family 4 protein [Rhodocyclaceae bacterium]